MTNIIIGKLSDQNIKRCTKNRRVTIITDDNVKKLYLKELLELTDNPLIYSILPGEKSKSREIKEKIEDFMLKHEVSRDSVIIALGGGVVTDIAGFVASTYKRGISYINIPTTLLGMVDASIGGKTGIDTPHGKNLIGTIWHPEAVLIDVGFLSTLPKDELTNGMAEVIKIAAILDKSFFKFLEKADLNDKTNMVKIIKKAIELKLKLVKKDARDNGARNLLNFGHTVGHALEKCSNYKLKHGHCVSIGMVIESKLSRNLEILKEKELTRLVNLLKKNDLPIKLPKIDLKCVIEAVKNDKKIESDIVKLVILERIGKSRLIRLNLKLIEKVLE